MRNRSIQFLSFRALAPRTRAEAKRGIYLGSKSKDERFLISHGFCSSAQWLLGTLGLISVVLISGCSGASAQKPVSKAPDLSGIWQGKGIQSLSPSDPTAHKPGAESDIPYTPWALAKMKAAVPAPGPKPSFENT